MEELGVIKYGELRFHFNLTDEVFSFIQKKNISRDFFIMSSQSFYQAILFKLGIGHKEKNEVEILFYSINFSKGQINSEIEKEYNKFSNFPAGELMLSFGAKVK